MIDHNIKSRFHRKPKCRGFESFSADQFFEANYTPYAVAVEMITSIGINENSRVLEPSAGTGNITDCISQYTNKIVSVELNKTSFGILKSSAGHHHNKDFLEMEIDDIGLFSHIVMCPPKNSDAHIEHAVKFLQPDGKLVALVQTQNIDIERWNPLILPDIFRYNGVNIECGVIHV